MKIQTKTTKFNMPIFYSKQWQNAFFQIVFRFVVRIHSMREPNDSSRFTPNTRFSLNDDGWKHKRLTGKLKMFIREKVVQIFAKIFADFLQMIFCWLQKHIELHVIYVLIKIFNWHHHYNTLEVHERTIRIFIFIFPKKQFYHSFELQRDA